MIARAAWLCDEVLLVWEPDGPDPILALSASDPLPAEVEEKLTDLTTFLREGPAGWDAAARTQLLGYLVSVAGELGLSPSLSEGLHRVREALRQRRPLSLPDRRAGIALAVERLHRIDEHGFYIRGRAWAEAASVVKLTAITPEGERVELRELVCRHPGAEGGFAGLFEPTFPTRGSDGWVFEAAIDSDHAVEAPAPISPDPLQSIFADAGLDFAGAKELRERHLRPAVSRLRQLQRSRTEIVELGGHGEAPGSPAISLVVPLQRRVDLIEHQIAQLAGDPEVGECELLYVLGEPDQSDALQELAAELFALYGLPLRLTALSEAAGLPVACDLGASLARGQRLVFLGSDVIPDRPGWLSAMAAALDADATVAAATPKLLYADGAIDQAGLEYGQDLPSGEGRVIHRLRGMHRDIAAAAAGGPVAAAGLACLMVDSAALAEAGGLGGEYGLADYEGSDLSRRLAETGWGLRYVPEAELYRLEGLGAEPEALAEPYARWLHSRLWAEATAEVTA
jgi:GT2 family glycosyltransferase